MAVVERFSTAELMTVVIVEYEDWENTLATVVQSFASVVPGIQVEPHL